MENKKEKKLDNKELINKSKEKFQEDLDDFIFAEQNNKKCSEK